MHQYQVWIRLNQTQTAHVIVNANNDLQDKMLAEAQYGAGNVLSYFRVD